MGPGRLSTEKGKQRDTRQQDCKRETMRNGRKIVDTDCHQMEPAAMWQEHIDPEFRDAAPCIKKVRGRNTMTVEGQSLVSEEKYPFSTPDFLAAMARGMQRFQRVLTAGYAPEARLEDMDEHGIDIQILFPTVGGQLLGREFENTDLLGACCRAFNNWSAEYASARVAGLRWAAMLPAQDPTLAAEEIRRTAAKGCTAYYMRPNPVCERDLADEAYDPVFAAAAASNRPICFHDSGSPHIPSFGDRFPTHTTGHIVAHPFEAMSAMMSLIWGGIFERYPDLRVVHVEADAGWVPYWLQRMEQHYEFSGNAEHPNLKLAPTEYFKRNVWVAARGDERTLPAALDLVGDDKFLFDTDYPHPDGTFPWGMESLEKQPIPDESIRKIFWDNPATAFAL